MRTLNLSGFKPSDSLSISVSQNALTAGPVSIPAWGGGGTGGSITINVHRSSLHVAPSSVRFSVDLSASSFDTPGPTGDETYDARLHDLIYLWDFDDPGTWTAPVQNLAAHKNRNAGKGPIEANMYRTPGTYNPSVLVIEPSTGKTATASVSVEVTDPEVVFAGSKTICINPVGDSDFTGAPAGAVQINVDLLNEAHTAWKDQLSTTEVKRWLFKGGVTHATNLWLGWREEAGAYFGSYGSGRAILRTERRTTITNVNIDNQCFVSNWAIKVDCQYWFVNLEGAGNFDPTTGIPNNASGYDQTFIQYRDTGYITMSNCYLHNYMNTCVYAGGFTSSYVTGYASGIQVLHADDCVIENTAGAGYTTFQAFGAAYPGTWWVFTGTRISLHPETWDSDTIRSAMRINDAMQEIVKGCDIFYVDSQQQAVKFAETVKGHGAIVNCHSNAMEGHLHVIRFNGNWTQTHTGGTNELNAIVDGNIFCGTHSSGQLISVHGTGVTIRNNLFYVPDQQYQVYRFSAAVIATIVYGTPAAHVLAAPVKVYNNTLRNDRTAANNGNEIYGPPVFLIDDSAGAYPVFSENNVVHMPYTLTPQVSFAPVSDAVLFIPRSTGWINAYGLNGEAVPTSHPEAAPLTSVKDTRPLTGSVALGSALSGNVSYMDILGTTRTAPADKGAWEVA